jgi:hypothetical protein
MVGATAGEFVVPVDFRDSAEFLSSVLATAIMLT